MTRHPNITREMLEFMLIHLGDGVSTEIQDSRKLDRVRELMSVVKNQIKYIFEKR